MPALASLLETTIIGIACPARGCACPVFVPADSNREAVDCNWCDARWITHQDAVDGKVTLKPRQENR
jgi:hypothetical protein